jgi:hypothetical protein
MAKVGSEYPAMAVGSDVLTRRVGRLRRAGGYGFGLGEFVGGPPLFEKLDQR